MTSSKIWAKCKQIVPNLRVELPMSQLFENRLSSNRFSLRETVKKIGKNYLTKIPTKSSFVKNSTPKMRASTKRGALIIFEGCDRSGKTTQCQRIVKHLSDNLPMINDQPSTIMMRFPDRNTKVGHAIDAYLQGKSQLGKVHF